jgi:hypothetical protein
LESHRGHFPCNLQAFCLVPWRTYVPMARKQKRGDIDPSLASPIPHVKKKGRPPDPRRTKPVKIRKCQRHGRSEFALYGSVRPRWRCKRCIGEAVTRRLQKIKRMLVREAGGCCCVCGYDRCIINLHFHHVDPSKKSFPMTVAMGKSIKTFREERKKCVLTCANCHGEIEAGIIKCPPLGATYATYGALVGRGGKRAA